MLAVSTFVLKTLWLWLTVLHLEVRFFIQILVPRQEEEEIILLTDGNISALCLDTVLIFVYLGTREQSNNSSGARLKRPWGSRFALQNCENQVVDVFWESRENRAA